MRPIDLTPKKFGVLHSILEINYFSDLDQLPDEIKALAYHAVRNLPLFLAHEEKFKEHNVDEVIRELGEILGHPAPQNPTQIKSPTNDSQIGKLLEMSLKPYSIITHYDTNETPVRGRQGLLNLNKDAKETEIINRDEVVAYIGAQIDERLAALPSSSQTPVDIATPTTEVIIPPEMMPAITRHLKNAKDFLTADDANTLTAEHIWHAMNGRLSCVNSNNLSFYAYYQFLARIAVIHGETKYLSLFENDSDKTALLYMLLQGKRTEKLMALLREHGSSIPPYFANEFLRMILSQEPVNEDFLFYVIHTFRISDSKKAFYLESYIRKCSEKISEENLNVEKALPIARVAIIILRNLGTEIKLSTSEQYLSAVAKNLTQSLELKILIQLQSRLLKCMESNSPTKTQFKQLLAEGNYDTVVKMLKSTDAFPRFLSLEDLKEINTLTQGKLSIEMEKVNSLSSLFDMLLHHDQDKFTLGGSYRLTSSIKVHYLPSVDPSLPKPIAFAAATTHNGSFQFQPLNSRIELASPTTPFTFSFATTPSSAAMAAAAAAAPTQAAISPLSSAQSSVNEAFYPGESPTVATSSFQTTTNSFSVGRSLSRAPSSTAPSSTEDLATSFRGLRIRRGRNPAQ